MDRQTGPTGHHGWVAVGLAITVGVTQQDRVARGAPSSIDVAIRRHGQHAHVAHAFGEPADLEPFWYVQRRGVARQRGARRRLEN